MPDVIISQFSRAFNAPIELFRQVADITTRDAINSNIRWEGMLVYVVSAGVTFELKGGIDNTDWTEVGAFEDAPEDGSAYGRKDGAWTPINENFSGKAGLSTQFLTDSSADGVRTNFVILSYTIQISDMNENGDIFRFFYEAQTNPNGGNNTVELRFFGTTTTGVFNVGGAAGLVAYRIECDILRLSPTTGCLSVKTFYPNQVVYKRFEVTGDFSIANSIQIRLTTTDAGSVHTAKDFIGQFLIF